MGGWLAGLGSAGGENGFLEMPTGSGKTVAAVNALKDHLPEGDAILWVAHNSYLLEQAKSAFESVYGTSFRRRIGFLSGTQKDFDKQVTLATVQTLVASDLSAVTEICELNRPTIVVFDEFHRSAADKWRQVVARFTREGVPLVGLSATPTRTDEAKLKWLQKNFKTCVCRVGMTELIQDGVLARPRVFRVHVKAPALKLSPKELRDLQRMHDLPSSVLKRLGEQDKRNRLILKTYKAPNSPMKQALVFCCDVAHAKGLADQFNEAGVNAQAVIGSAAHPDNRKALEDFKAGDLQVLTSVILLTEGVDLPNCDTVFLARPTQSEILVKQMIGRAMRGPKNGGNANCTIIDFVDAFDNIGDMSSTSLGFMREYDESLAPILRRKPTRSDRTGRDLAALLRVRDWLAQHGEDIDTKHVFYKEIFGILQFFDGQAGVNKAVIMYENEKKTFQAAIGSVMELKRAEREHPIALATAARSIYHEHFSADAQTAEEDFVSAVMQEAQEPKSVERRLAKDLVNDLRDSAVLMLPPVDKALGGLQHLQGLFD